jgi:hypothetical protein
LQPRAYNKGKQISSSLESSLRRESYKRSLIDVIHWITLPMLIAKWNKGTKGQCRHHCGTER